ncbi:MAG: Gfo/Idh/MocA family oxidoreductase [Opitutales bacterium]|nr:Gfo/Idh/MocA family oxidoreductase [Opitutales bacterium]
MSTAQKLKMGMVGGGRDAFIGAVHRHAAWLDGQIELVAGCFSSDPEKSRLSGEDLGIAPGRIYHSYEEMATAEAKLPEGERIDFVAIVTPNFLHAPVAMAFIDKGFHIVCDKPLTAQLEDAERLYKAVEDSGLIFALTHNYTGYPMVKEARERVQRGEIGEILKIVAEYPQGWLADQIEQDGQKQAAWRTDPEKAGGSCCLGDIGTHAENLGRYITGLKIESLCAHFTTFVEGRPLEDDANLLVRYENGAVGILYASQISLGEENNLTIRIYGTKGALAWKQEHPNELFLTLKDQPIQTLRRGNPYLGAASQRFTRIPPGHPEAFIEAFANIYLEAARAIRDRKAGRSTYDYDFPTVGDGLYGMQFLSTAIRSAASGEKWTKFVG